MADGRFHVAVLGEFKRGKSTLVNALIGADVLPTRVLPLTAVATEVMYGPKGATVVFLDDRRQEVPLDDVALYVTGAGNPGNERQVDRVEVRVPAPLLEPGVVLVDTPGMGSVYVHNTEAGRAALLEADGAIVVLSADTPLSAQERELLTLLAERQARTFILVNRADHVDPVDLETVRRFITQVVSDELGRKPELYCLAARPGLAARLEGRGPGPEAADFSSFLDAFEEFVDAELVDARLAAARYELARVGHALREALLLRAVALEFDAATLTSRVEAFRAAAAAQEAAFDEDLVLLGHETDALIKIVGERVYAFARAAPRRWRSTIEIEAGSLPIGHLEEGLRAVVGRCVHEGFEEFLAQEAARVEDAWRTLAQRFRARTDERVNAVRCHAADLFSIELPQVAIPEVAEEREQFFYLFLHVGTSTETLGRLARRLLPSSVVRRRLLVQAHEHLASQFDKHAGRARWDLAQRLDAVRRRFEAAMRMELDVAIEAILNAAQRTDELRVETKAQLTRRVTADAHALALAEQATAFGTPDA